MLVRDWMSPDPLTVTPATEVATARKLLRTYGVRHLPVVAARGVVGMISDRDVRVDETKLPHDPGAGATVDTVMSSPPQVIAPEDTVEAAARLMLSRRISALPVVAGGELLGVITTTDCLLASLSPHPAASG